MRICSLQRVRCDGSDLISPLPAVIGSFSLFITLGQAVKPEEGQLIPIAPLKCEASVNEVEEAASTQSWRVPPAETLAKFHLYCGSHGGFPLSSIGSAAGRALRFGLSKVSRKQRLGSRLPDFHY